LIFKKSSKHQRKIFIQDICASSACFTSYFPFGSKLGDSSEQSFVKKSKGWKERSWSSFRYWH